MNRPYFSVVVGYHETDLASDLLYTVPMVCPQGQFRLVLSLSLGLFLSHEDTHTGGLSLSLSLSLSLPPYPALCLIRISKTDAMKMNQLTVRWWRSHRLKSTGNFLLSKLN